LESKIYDLDYDLRSVKKELQDEIYNRENGH